MLPLARKITAPLLALLLAVTVFARADERQDKDTPHVPAALQVPAGNKLLGRAHGEGVQIYTWSAALATWGASTPHANLYADGKIAAIHYAGPTWQDTDGSKVEGKKLDAVTVDPDSIPWLLLQATTSGPGVFANVTYVQRLRTRGGLAPAAAGTFDGQQVLVPYTAEYLFYVAD